MCKILFETVVSAVNHKFIFPVIHFGRTSPKTAMFLFSLGTVPALALLS